MVEAFVKLIQQNGGKLRADKFLQAHLMGPDGYYSKNVDFSRRDSRPVTPSVEWAGHAEKTAIAIFNLVDETNCNAIMPEDGKVKFVEIGGGGGQFKRALLEFERMHGLSGGFRLDYTSVEPSENQQKNQSAEGTKIQAGIAQATNLPNEYAHYLFDEEVIDCLAPRMFRATVDEKVVRFNEEVFFIEKGGRLAVKLEPVEEDEKLAFFEKYANATRGCYEDGEIAYLSHDYWSYWEERKRVLHPKGASISIDYGRAGESSMKNSLSSLTVELFGKIMQKVESSLDMLKPIIRNPGQVDFTHTIDFALQREIADQVGFKSVIVSVSDLAQSYGIRMTTEEYLTLSSRFVMLATLKNERER